MPMMDQVRCEDISLASDHRESKEREGFGQRAEADVSTGIVATFLNMYINGPRERWDVYRGGRYAFSRASVPHNPIDWRRDTD